MEERQNKKSVALKRFAVKQLHTTTSGQTGRQEEARVCCFLTGSLCTGCQHSTAHTSTNGHQYFVQPRRLSMST